MDIKKLGSQITDFFKNLPLLIKNFPAKSKKASLGEKIAYLCIGLGVLLIFISLFMF